MLQTAYHLDENATRVLMSTKLKGRALNWLHSRSEHLTMNIENLLGQMRVMFDHCPTKLALRREFEKRKWQSMETFSAYFHDKIILGNRVPISNEEIVDYILDGIPDTRLRD